MKLCLRGTYSMCFLASIGLLSFFGGLPLFSQESAETAETGAALYAPYWRLGDRFETTIMVNNTRPKDVTITTYVYTTSGERLPSISFTVGAMGTKTFSLGEILVNRTNERTGYVKLQFSGAPVDIAAQVLIEDQAQHLRWNHVFEPKKRYLSSRYEGVFMGSGEFEGATLALTNVSSNTLVASFSLAEGARQTGKTYQLPPHTQRVIALSDYLARSQAPGRRAVGISISHSGSPGDVIAQGLASLGRGGAYNIHIADSARLKSSSLISTVLALPGAHTPFLAIRNTSSEHSGISLIAHYKPVKTRIHKS